MILPLDHNKVLHIDALGKRSLRLQASNQSFKSFEIIFNWFQSSEVSSQPPDAQTLFIAMKDEYETVEEALMRATGGEISETITLPE